MVATGDITLIRTTEASRFTLRLNGEELLVFPLAVNHVSGSDPSTCTVECPALATGYAAEGPVELRFWNTIPIGTPATVYIDDLPAFVGYVVSTAHDVAQDIGELELADMRWLLAGIPVIGRFTAVPENEDLVKDTAKELDRINFCIKYWQDKMAQPGQTEEEILASLAKITAWNAEYAAWEAYQLSLLESSGTACVVYEQRLDAVFNEGGLPNCWDGPLGPVFTPYPNYRVYGSDLPDTVSVKGNFKTEVGSTATYWNVGKVIQYLRNIYYNSWYPFTVAQKNFPYLKKIETMEPFIWPEDMGIKGDGVDIINIGTDEKNAANDLKNNNRLLGPQSRLPEIAIKGLYLNEVLSKLARSLGAYDLSVRTTETDVEVDGDETFEVGAAQTAVLDKKGEILGLRENGKSAQTVGVTKLMFVPTFRNPRSDDYARSLTVADDATNPPPFSVHTGVLRRDGRSWFNEVIVNAAPIMLETRVNFDPANNATYSGAEPESNALLPAWVRQWNTNTAAATDNQTEGDEYGFLEYIATGGGYPDQAGSPEAFRQARIKYPTVFCAYYLNPQFDYRVGTPYADYMKTLKSPPPLGWLLTAISEVFYEQGNNTYGTQYRRFPYKVLAEVMKDDPSILWKDAGTDDISAATTLDGFNVDNVGNIWLEGLCESSLNNVPPYLGSYFGVLFLPRLIRPRPIRMTLAFPMDWKLVEHVASVSKATDYAVNQLTQDASGNWTTSASYADSSAFYADAARTIKRQYLADVGGAYREYLRRNSWAVPEVVPTSLTDDFLPDAVGPLDGQKLFCEREAAKIHAKRRHANVSRVNYTGTVALDGIVHIYPGDGVNYLRNASGTKKLYFPAVVKTTVHDYKGQQTLVTFA